MWQCHGAFCLTKGEQWHKVTKMIRHAPAGSAGLTFLLMGYEETMTPPYAVRSGSLFSRLPVLFFFPSSPSLGERRC